MTHEGILHKAAVHRGGIAKKSLPVGEEGFVDLIRKNCYYVDKTAYLKPLLESGSYVHLITRPRRFGKTLFLNTLRRFLEINLKNPDDRSLQEELFADLKIRREQALCDRFMGRCPVLSVTLKNVKGPSFEEAMQSLAETLQPIVEQFASLADSPRLTPDDRSYLRQCCMREHMLDPKNLPDLQAFLGKMAVILGRHFGRQVFLLIDEYDVPLQKAMKAGCYPEMLAFMQGFLSCLKPGDTMYLEDGRHAVQKAVLTGCLRVSKASIFTDLNNLNVNSVCTQGGPLSSAIGFTPSEVEDLLAFYGLEAQGAVVKDWYDGYRIGKAELYCPWDVIHFCDDILADGVDLKTFKPQNYWIDTSSHDALQPYIDYLTKADSGMMQALVDGEEIETTLNEQVAYGDLHAHRPEDFWTLLLFSGYLTVAGRKGDAYRLKIPNEEVRDAFKRRIQWMFSPRNPGFASSGVQLKNAALAGDADAMSNVLFEVLADFVSIRDSATRAPAENYYHGMLIGLFACVPKNEIAFFESNREAGDGFADISFTSPQMPRTGVVIELKKAASEDALESVAQKALEQIRRMHYVQGFRRKLCSRIFVYGIAFHGKACMVLSEEFKPEDR